MNILTICYSTHRPETLGFSARIMQEHDLILLEEPPHPDFQRMLNGEIDLDEHMLEIDPGYPVFARRQYKLLQFMKKAGKEIVQAEPFLEKLLHIHFFFADGHSPDEIDIESEEYEVYCRERDATGTLLDYYQTVRSADYGAILKSMQAFARADAARFMLRDILRAKRIISLLQAGRKTYIEAGSIHLALHKYLGQKLPDDWSLRVHFIEREAMQRIGLKGSIFNPGDELTLSYIFGKTMRQEREDLLCAQSLIYAKLVRKDETRPDDTAFPHTRDDVETIAIARALSLDACHELFYRIRTMTTDDAGIYVRKYLKRRGLSMC